MKRPKTIREARRALVDAVQADEDGLLDRVPVLADDLIDAAIEEVARDIERTSISLWRRDSVVQRIRALKIHLEL